MRLFGIVDGSVNRYERASWLTCPFDLALSGAAAVEIGQVAGQIVHSIVTAGQVVGGCATRAQLVGSSVTAGQVF